jgi:hypothetical protein
LHISTPEPCKFKGQAASPLPEIVTSYCYEIENDDKQRDPARAFGGISRRLIVSQKVACSYNGATKIATSPGHFSRTRKTAILSHTSQFGLAAAGLAGKAVHPTGHHVPLVLRKPQRSSTSIERDQAAA